MKAVKNIRADEAEIVLRPSSKIKSRQWWQAKTRKLIRLIRRDLPKKKTSHLKNTIFTLLITNNKEIQDLNKRFRNIDKPTDVLSFHLKFKEQEVKKYLGDIVISAQYAKKQSKRKKSSLEKELILLLVHGYLHLLGYDHKFKKEEEKMFSIQNSLTNEITNQK